MDALIFWSDICIFANLSRRSLETLGGAHLDVITIEAEHRKLSTSSQNRTNYEDDYCEELKQLSKKIIMKRRLRLGKDTWAASLASRYWMRYPKAEWS